MDNPQLKSKEIIYKKALEFTNLYREIYCISVSYSAMQAVMCDYAAYTVTFSCCSQLHGKKKNTVTLQDRTLVPTRSVDPIYQNFIHNKMQICGHILLLWVIVHCHIDLLRQNLWDFCFYVGTFNLNCHTTHTSRTPTAVRVSYKINRLPAGTWLKIMVCIGYTYKVLNSKWWFTEDNKM